MKQIAHANRATDGMNTLYRHKIRMHEKKEQRLLLFALLTEG
ncbi:hypothetical protein [Paenibacillus glycanilyticus]|nr:hypothetical protein [Paenibacillus glycanilyticus]